jgi:hypothetical protein
MLPGFSYRDLVAVLINYNENGPGRCLFALFICPMILRILPSQRNLRNSCIIVRMKTSICHTKWGSTNCDDRGEALVEFYESGDSKSGQ